jgi:hypothetical protein
MFIPKPGKVDRIEVKAYPSFSLLSFILKTMEKVVDSHISDGALRKSPLHRNPHNYQTGKSTETTLQMDLFYAGNQGNN